MLQTIFYMNPRLTIIRVAIDERSKFIFLSYSLLLNFYLHLFGCERIEWFNQGLFAEYINFMYTINMNYIKNIHIL